MRYSKRLKFPQGLGLGLLMGLTLPAQAVQHFKGYRRADFAKAPLVSEISNTVVVHLAIGLPIRNADKLNALLAALTDPHSPQYRHYLTPKQFNDQFCASPEDYQALVDFMKAQGLKATADPVHHMVLDVDATVDGIQKTFHTRLHHYKRPDGSLFYAPDAEPSVDLDLPIAHISGLENYHLPRRHQAPPIPQNAGGSGSERTPYGQRRRNAYVPGVTLDGSGQSVALLEFSTYTQANIDDYKNYRTSVGLSNPTVQNITIPDGSLGSGGDDEVSLDIDMSIAMAPAATVMVYMGNTADDVLAKIANDDVAKQISSSWSWLDNGDPVELAIEAQFVAQGQTYIDCSGDEGGSAALSGRLQHF